MIPLSQDSLWDGALNFLGDYYSDTEIREAVKEKLLRWEHFPTELGLVQLRAEFTVPQRWPHLMCGVPEHVIRLGDIGAIGCGTTNWRTLTSQDLGKQRLEQYSGLRIKCLPLSDQQAGFTSTIEVWNNGELISSVSNPAPGWQR